MDTECTACQRKYSNIKLIWRCPACASEQMEAAPSASTNTGSPKLPLLENVESHIKGLCRDGAYPVGDVLTGAQLAYDYIERQLRASA